MDPLLNLKDLANDLVEKYKSLFSGNDIELPIEFKQKVKNIDTSSISYQKYSATVSTKGGQKGSLYIYFPNQWFYIASFFTKYYNELQKYKKVAIDTFSPERLKELKGSSLTPAEKNKLNSKLGNDNSNLIETFVTDYDWWGGGKTIDRGDYYVSPILNYASLVNVSQAYVADLCAFLAKNEDLVLLLQKRVDLETKKTSTNNNSALLTKVFLPYLTALRTKPFMLLAGISGTGKSRIVRELAKACWQEGDEEYGKNNPKNFCMVQVKPNWHDSTELFGYVSRISGKSEFVAGDFLKFIIKAWEDLDVPYFLCLDEMNLAPVEQYFAEYLSVIESRKSDGDTIITDPIFKKPFEDKEYNDTVNYGEDMDWYQKFIVDHTSNMDLRKQFYKEGISIPQNLFVVGTVNMDETTFSFSRKVLDRAMTLEMNEVDLHGGLEKGKDNEKGYIGNSIIGDAAEGCDVYEQNKDLCDQVLAYLEKLNTVLEGTPFKIAYRTRNEFLLYAVNRQLLDEKSQLWQTLDEMTSMKILSRIEGDSERTKTVLEGLEELVKTEIISQISEPKEGKSISAAKIDEMKKKLVSGYTSYWA